MDVINDGKMLSPLQSLSKGEGSEVDVINDGRSALGFSRRFGYRFPFSPLLLKLRWESLQHARALINQITLAAQSQIILL